MTVQPLAALMGHMSTMLCVLLLCMLFCRAPVNSSKAFRTQLWLSALNITDNLPQNRYVLGYDVLGFQVGSDSLPTWPHRARDS